VGSRASVIMRSPTACPIVQYRRVFFPLASPCVIFHNLPEIFILLSPRPSPSKSLLLTPQFPPPSRSRTLRMSLVLSVLRKPCFTHTTTSSPPCLPLPYCTPMNTHMHTSPRLPPPLPTACRTVPMSNRGTQSAYPLCALPPA